MNKKLKIFIFILSNILIILSCGHNSQAHFSIRSDSKFSSRLSDKKVYYIISEIYFPNGKKLLFHSDLENDNRHEPLFLLQFNKSQQPSYKLDCKSESSCLKLSPIILSKAAKIYEILKQLNIPDKITYITDSNGYKYTAQKLNDSDEIKTFKKLFISENSIPVI